MALAFSCEWVFYFFGKAQIARFNTSVQYVGSIRRFNTSVQYDRMGALVLIDEYGSQKIK